MSDPYQVSFLLHEIFCEVLMNTFMDYSIIEWSYISAEDYILIYQNTPFIKLFRN